MSAEVIVYVLTALAAVVIVLTRLRLGGDGGAGSMDVGRGLLNVHTLFGVLALVLWVLFLVGDDETVLGGPGMGIFALACWWITVVAGLLILVRWLPSRGRHAENARQDTWSEGPGLSVLAHVGMLVGVVIFTIAYLKAWV